MVVFAPEREGIESAEVDRLDSSNDNPRDEIL